MQRFEIDINLEHIKAQRKAWNDAAREFNELVDKAMTRLIHEGAVLRMSHTEVARKAGFTSHQIRQRMKAMGLNPSVGKSLLSKQAADVLAKNAEIMGIQPHEIDLMSPLAYLPAGPLLKHETSSVTELEPEPVAEGFWCVSCEFLETNDFEDGGCMSCGCPEESHVKVKLVAQTGEDGA